MLACLIFFNISLFLCRKISVNCCSIWTRWTLKPTLYQVFQQHIWRRHQQVQHQVLTVSDQASKMTLFHWRHVEYNTTRGNENLQMNTPLEMRKSQDRVTTHVCKTQKNSLQIVSNYRQHVREVIAHLVVQTRLIL